MNKTKIEWCDSSWNPVTGCYHSCEYCYARKMANRFDGGYVSGGKKRGNYCLSDKATRYIITPELNDGHILMTQHNPIFENIGILDKDDKKYAAYPFGFCPTIHRQRLYEPAQKKKHQNIFVCSMADLFGDWVPAEWIQEVFKACEAAPQHRYLFLTKNPNRIKKMYFDNLPLKHWYGQTVTGGNVFGMPMANRSFISFEPLLSEVNISPLVYFGWAIIGAETGTKGKTAPKKEWVKNIVDFCNGKNIPVFMKDSLIPIVGEENMIREFPWRNQI